MNKTILSLAMVAAYATFAIGSFGATTVASSATQPTMTLAKHGADDAAGDIKGEGAGHPVLLAKHGADDAAGDVKGEGAGHPVTLA